MRLHRAPAVGCCFALSALGTSLLAQRPDSATASDSAAVVAHTAQPERPTVATHAYTVAPGYVEIETGVQDAQPRGSSALVAPLVAKLGLTTRLQLELQESFASYSASGVASRGVGDAAIALKQRVLIAAPILSDFSVQGTLKLATGARGVGTGTTDVSLLLISSRQIRSAELDLNAGYTHRSGDGTSAPVNSTLAAAALGGQIAGALGGVAELFTYPHTTGAMAAPTQIGVTVGPTWRLQPWLVLDAGAILNVRALSSNALYAGLTYNVGRISGFPMQR